MMYANIREEELKNKVALEYFGAFDATRIIGNIDFCIALPAPPKQEQLYELESLLWAEAKKGSADVYKSIVQLVLTIGKARTFDKQLPPAFLGAFDAEKIAFVSYNAVQDVFYQNDFNWNVTPSNHETKEFKQLYEMIREAIEGDSLLFQFGIDDKDLREFIATNFVVGKANVSKIKIDKNNFMVIYNKWLGVVKPTIMLNWDVAKKNNIVDGDFYLADLLSHENESLKEKLYVFLKKDYYELDGSFDEMGLFSSKKTFFKDKQKAHTQFWNKYERPPKEEYWDYIVGRRDLLVPQDVRERKGSFFTPQIWVELSQKYLADTLGEHWQDEYYIWDCAAGTGNLLTGLTNKFHIWASTLDRQDVDVMRDRIKNGANLVEDNVFQFDFLNDDFAKLPKDLLAIIQSPEKRKKLIIYINPPYAEASSRDTVTGKGENKSNVSTETKVYQEFQNTIGTAARELFAQFFVKAYSKFPESILAQFSKLKVIQSTNFDKFRNFFKAEFKNGFVVPADTFDNVKGKFPIGFFIWDMNKKNRIDKIECDVFNSKGILLGKKKFYAHDKGVFMIDWLRKYYDKQSERIAYLRMVGTDMQNNQGVFITNQPSENDIVKSLTTNITKNNVIEMCMYLAMRHVIEQNWLNDRDQFLYPDTAWEKDNEFQHDCLAYTLFHGQNRISAIGGSINHWIPFTEYEVDARSKFASDFMARFLAGKVQNDSNNTLFTKPSEKTQKAAAVPLVFSAEAEAVFAAGKALWSYYHAVIKKIPLVALPADAVNASLYDIKAYFQERNASGKMNSKSEDATYMVLIGALRDSLKVLAKKIVPKVYAYGFLKG